MSPDGEAIVTGAGDETLRFWNVFSKMRSTKVLILPFSHTHVIITVPSFVLSPFSAEFQESVSVLNLFTRIR